MAHILTVCVIDVHQLAAIVRNRIDNALILDSRSFLEYNCSHVINAINVGCAKLMKRRLQQEKLSIQDFLAQNCHWDVDTSIDIIVYDQNTSDVKCLPPDSFMAVFLHKLLPVYHSVNILKGGFLEFQAAYPSLCEDEKTKFAPLTSLSQPCLSITNHGPTRILPFLYLGSQHDALNKEVLQYYNITYELNVSTNCPKPDFIQESHFMRIPVIDNYSEKLLPHFPKAFQFLDKVRESGGCALVHCLAGVSRSATIAIAYVMKHLKMSSDEAYRYVKAKRATISPNFNFLGQLLEYEKELHQDESLELKSELSAPLINISSPNWNFDCISKSTSETPSDFAYDISCKYSGIAESEMFSKDNKYQGYVKTNEYYMAFGKEMLSKDMHLANPHSHKRNATLNIKCIPATSLKELNFTPCQTSVKALHYSCSFNNNCCLSKTENVGISTSHFTAKKDERNNDLSTEGCFIDNKNEDTKTHISMASHMLMPSELKPFEFNNKTYVRSDSLSTSGIGSEGSDYADSWNDYTSSCERETDILMDDDYPSVPTDDDELRQKKLLSFEDSYEESLSLYPKYESNYNTPHTHIQCYISDFTHTVPNRNDIEDNQNISNYKAESHYPQNESYLKEFDKNHILYRVQSCPGMFNSESSASRSPSIEQLIGNKTVVLRRTRSKNSDKDKCRNRYSCSSLDYVEFSPNTALLHESCPDVLHFSSGSDNSTISSHNYRHSMIQVS